jgi:glycosyltransferase involved in cell wall biosynthesis
LRSVVQQSYKNIEVIIIDSYSSDNTVAIAKKYGAKVVYERKLPRQRMRGIMESKGDYILLLDSDQELETRAIEKCMKESEEKGYDALILREKSIYNEKSWFSRLLAYNMEIVQRDPDAYLGTALPRFFKATFLKKINSIPDDLGYFDHAFIYYEVLRLGAKVGYANVIVYHHEIDSIARFIKKFYKYYGLCIIPAMKYNRKLTIRRSLPRRIYFSKEVIRKPRIFLGLLFLYALKALATSTGIIVYIIKSLPLLKK